MRIPAVSLLTAWATNVQVELFLALDWQMDCHRLMQQAHTTGNVVTVLTVRRFRNLGLTQSDAPDWRSLWRCGGDCAVHIVTM